MAKWSESEMALCFKLWNKGHSATEIAAKLNYRFNSERSRLSVIGKIHRERINHPDGLVTRPLRERKRYDQVKPKPYFLFRRKGTPPKKPRTENNTTLMPELPELPESPESRCLLTDLRHGLCKWPYGTKTPYHFCAAPALPDKSYCAKHWIEGHRN